MRELAGFILFSVILAAGAAALTTAYFLPTIVALIRRPAGMVAEVVVLNVFLGWTFLGWALSLALAFEGTSRAPLVPGTTGNQPASGRPAVVPGASLASIGHEDASQGALVSDHPARDAGLQ